ncbi:MAG: hypothetical protein J0H31_18295 [Alphaproteobacteria bacterium]|nr:hypothetical protein [Alphaproteobacteria bacterium]
MPSSPYPPAETALPRFVVGRDGEGRWIARDEDGHTGGVFADKASAIHFACMESGHRGGAVRIATTRLLLFS